MKKIGIIVLTLSMLFMFSGPLGQVAHGESNLDIKGTTIIGGDGYLTEEEVIEAIATTSNDTKLLGLIDAKKMKNGMAVVNEFHAEDYCKYTKEQFAGMYLNDNGQLVLCYTDNRDIFSKAVEGSEFNKVKSSLGKYSNKLISRSKEVIVNSVIVMNVKYNYAELQKAYELLNEYSNKFRLSGFGIDVENNRIEVHILADSDRKSLEKELLSLFDKDMFSFVMIDSDDTFKEIATIDGTSAIKADYGSYVSYSTPAGEMWSSSRGTYGVITCGHGYSNGTSIYSGSTKIGTISAHNYNSTNDSSFIVLDSGNSYSGTCVDVINSSVPVVNANITLRGYQSGTKSATVTSTNWSQTINGTNGINYTGMTKVNQPMLSGDSGGGAIGRIIDSGRTNCIVAINKAASSSETLLIKGSVIINAYS